MYCHILVLCEKFIKNLFIQKYKKKINYFLRECDVIVLLSVLTRALISN